MINLQNIESNEVKNLIKLWQEFQTNYSDAEKKRLKENYQNLLEEWNGYSEKIRAEKESERLPLDEYTNLKNKNEKEYLCHFLERKTSEIFGSSNVTGSANSLMVKQNQEDGLYYIYKYEKNKDKKNVQSHTRENAEEVYNGEVFPILHNILKPQEIKKKITVAKEQSEKKGEHEGYKAKLLLRKMIALEHPEAFIYIYSKEQLQILYDSFGDATNKKLNEWELFCENSNIKEKIAEVLGVKDEVDSILLTVFLYKYINAQSLTDESSPNVILYGPPGTGKTYEIQQMLDFLCKGDTSRYEILQFHPSFAYEDFIEGIKPKGVSDNGNIKFELVNGAFKKFCIKAKKECEEVVRRNKNKTGKNKEKPKDFYFVVDEINRANLSSVFGETLSLLEKDYRHNIRLNKDEEIIKDKKNLIKTQYSSMGSEDNAYEFINEEAYFGVPKNVFFIGMMNDVDKSIDTFDLALRRRFKWIRKDCNYEVILEHSRRPNGEDFDYIQEYIQCAKNLNNHISETLGLGKSYEFGHSFFIRIKDIAKHNTRITKSNLDKLFELYLRPTLKEYLRAFCSENEIEGKNGRLNEALEIFKKALPEKEKEKEKEKKKKKNETK